MNKELFLGTPIAYKIKEVVNSVSTPDELENITGINDRLAKRLFDANRDGDMKKFYGFRLDNAKRIMDVYDSITGEKAGLTIKTKFKLIDQLSSLFKKKDILKDLDLTYQSYASYVREPERLNSILVSTAMKIENFFKQHIYNRVMDFDDIHKTLPSVSLVSDDVNEGFLAYSAALALKDGQYSVIEPLDDHQDLMEAILKGEDFTFVDKEVNEDYTVIYHLTFEKGNANNQAMVTANCEKTMKLGNF